MITANGKEIDIVIATGTQHYKVQFKTGGQIPEWLSGAYTSYTKAKNDVMTYLNQEKGKKKSDG